MSSRTALWGAAAVLGYLGAALFTAWAGLLPVRPLYDGLVPPPPYNWVDPPEDVAEDNVVPQPQTFTVELTEEGSEPGSLATADAQVILLLPREAIPPMEGEEEVRVEVTPLVPFEVAEPPEDLEFDGNAYRLEAVYAASEEAVTLSRDVTVVLRYPVHAEIMLRYDEGAGWRELPTDRAPAGLQLFSDSDALGVFVSAAPPQNGFLRWFPSVAITIGVAAAVVMYIAQRRSRSRSGGRGRSSSRGSS